MKRNTLALSLTFLALTGGIAQAAVLNTTSVSTAKPVNVNNRNVMCMTQNLDQKKQRPVTVEVWLGNKNPPELLKTDTYTLLPNQASGWRLDSGVSGSIVQVFCRFKMDKSRVKGFLSVDDDFAQVLTVPAQ